MQRADASPGDDKKGLATNTQQPRVSEVPEPGIKERRGP
jgi:hypothetical protein